MWIYPGLFSKSLGKSFFMCCLVLKPQSNLKKKTKNVPPHNQKASAFLISIITDGDVHGGRVDFSHWAFYLPIKHTLQCKYVQACPTYCYTELTELNITFTPEYWHRLIENRRRFISWSEVRILPKNRLYFITFDNHYRNKDSPEVQWAQSPRMHIIKSNWAHCYGKIEWPDAILFLLQNWDFNCTVVWKGNKEGFQFGNARQTYRDL